MDWQTLRQALRVAGGQCERIGRKIEGVRRVDIVDGLGEGEVVGG